MGRLSPAQRMSEGHIRPDVPRSRRSMGTYLQLTQRLVRTVRMTIPRREAAYRMGELREALFSPCDGPALIYLALFGQDPWRTLR